MKKIRDCELVKDLLPNYIDNLTSKETNEFIETHILECSECKLLLDKMRNSNVLDEEVKSKKFVNFAKKYNKKLKIFKFISLIILSLILFHLIRNLIIVVPLLHKRNETLLNSNNYHYQMYSYNSKDYLSLYDTYRKDGKYLETWSSINIKTGDSTPKFLHYYDGDNLYEYNIDDRTGIKYYTVSELENVVTPIFMDSNDGFNDFTSILGMVIFPRITSMYYHGKDCYRIDFSRGHREQVTCIDKNSGLIIRGLTSDDATLDFYVDLNSVTDEDLTVPNIEDYVPYDEVENDLIKAELKELVENGEEIPDYYKDFMYLLDD